MSLGKGIRYRAIPSSKLYQALSDSPRLGPIWRSWEWNLGGVERLERCQGRERRLRHGDGGGGVVVN